MQLRERLNYKVTGIYKIENLITHEVYIGQAKNICIRIAQHLNSSVSMDRSDYDYPLHKAFRQYGIDNFDFEVLEVCSYDKLNEAEMYWVTKYNLYTAGYNQTKGGQQSIRLIKLNEQQVEEIKVLLKNTILFYKEIAIQYNVCEDTIRKINYGLMWHDNTINYPIRNILADETKYKFDGTCVLQLDKQTDEIIATYPSRNIAAETLGNTAYGTHIGQVISGKRNSAYGYKWAIQSISKESWLLLLEKYINKN